MKMKKNKFSYILWIFFSVFSGLSLTIDVIYMMNSFGFHDRHTIIGMVCLSFILCFSCYEFLNLCIYRFIENRLLSDKIWKLILRITVISVFVISFIGRLSYVSTVKTFLIENDLYYQKAISSSFSAKTAMEALYVYLLKGFMLIFVEGPRIAVLFQFLLEEAFFFVFYLFVKKLSNQTISVIFLVLAFLLRVFNQGFEKLNSEPLILIILLVSFLIFKGVGSYSEKNPEKKRQILLLSFGFGAISGLVSSLDVIGLTIPLTILIILFSELNFSKRREASKHSVILPMICLIFLGTILFFGVGIYLFYSSEFSFWSRLDYYRTLFFGNPYFDLHAIAFHESFLYGYILCVLETMWFFVFMNVPYDFAKFGTILWILLASIQLFHINVIDYTMISSVYPLILCVAGIYGIFYYQKYVRNANERKQLSFEDDPLQMVCNEAIEPAETKDGSQNWNQIFSDGRSLMEHAEILYRKEINPTFKKSSPVIPSVKNKTQPNGKLQYTVSVSDYEDYDITAISLEDDFDIQ